MRPYPKRVVYAISLNPQIKSKFTYTDVPEKVLMRA